MTPRDALGLIASLVDGVKLDEGEVFATMLDDSDALTVWVNHYDVDYHFELTTRITHRNGEPINPQPRKTPTVKNLRYQLRDTFNGRTISAHRSPESAGRAALAHDRAVTRSNGQGSYIPLALLQRSGSPGGYTYERCMDDDVIALFDAARNGVES